MTPVPDFPLPDLDWPPLEPFWRAAAVHELHLPRCTACGAFDWYPSGVCPNGHTSDIRWQRISGLGTLFSWSIIRRVLMPSLASLQPFVSAIVAIDENPSTRLVSRLVDVDPGELVGGLPVEVRFGDLAEPSGRTGIVAPLFTARRLR